MGVCVSHVHGLVDFACNKILHLNMFFKVRLLAQTLVPVVLKLLQILICIRNIMYCEWNKVGSVNLSTNMPCYME